MTTDQPANEPLTHEQNVARLLELEEAAEARRRKRRRAYPWIALAVVLVAVIVPVVIHQQNAAMRERCAQSQLYWETIGQPEKAPAC